MEPLFVVIIDTAKIPTMFLAPGGKWTSTINESQKFKTHQSAMEAAKLSAPHQKSITFCILQIIGLFGWG